MEDFEKRPVPVSFTEAFYMHLITLWFYPDQKHNNLQLILAG